MTEARPLDGRVVLVTGASRGLGAAVAEACAARGATLVLVARTAGGLEETDDRVRARGGGSATLVRLDLAKGELVDKLGPAVFERHGRLDGLVHAAGILGKLMPTAQLDPALLGQLMAVGVLGTQRLIRSVDPLLRAAPAGCAVFVGDAEAREGRAYWGGYAAMKAAQRALALAWAAETRLTRLRVELIDPGPMRTRLREHAYPGQRSADLPPPETAAEALAGRLAAALEAPRAAG